MEICALGVDCLGELALKEAFEREWLVVAKGWFVHD